MDARRCQRMSELLPTETKLSPELKAKWLAALRSGEYRQGHEHLCLLERRAEDVDVTCYCCLGVLAEVAGERLVPSTSVATLDDICRSDLVGGWGSPKEAFMAEEPETHTTIQRKLAAMNDTGKSFEEIADWIEANL